MPDYPLGALSRRANRKRTTSRVDPFNPKGKGSRYRNEASIEDTNGVMTDKGFDTEYRQAQEGRQTSRVTGPAVLRRLGLKDRPRPKRVYQ